MILGVTLHADPDTEESPLRSHLLKVCLFLSTEPILLLMLPNHSTDPVCHCVAGLELIETLNEAYG